MHAHKVAAGIRSLTLTDTTATTVAVVAVLLLLPLKNSLAVMSMVGYILGLGDRHPSNLMLDRFTGKILHIDFGDCFEVAMQRDKFPERVPFRLTRMLVNAMEVRHITILMYSLQFVMARWLYTACARVMQRCSDARFLLHYSWLQFQDTAFTVRLCMHASEAQQNCHPVLVKFC
jgi:Phosphatidylinositol 3- and 4-kinase